MQNSKMNGLLVCIALFGSLGVIRAEDASQQHGPHPLANTLGPKVEITAYDHGDISPWAEFFLFDRPSHPKIQQLRREYHLDDVVRDSKTDLDRAVAIKKWTFGSLVYGRPSPQVFKDWSAIALLKGAKRKEPVWCGQAAMVFQQACISLDMPCRFIESGVPHNPANHFLVEVYLREFEKWAVFDATAHVDFDVYYTVDGVPQSALEMHRHVVNKTLDEVTEVRPGGTRQGSDRIPTNLFYYLRWLTHNDIVTNTPRYHHMEDVFDKRWHTVEWTDEKTIPWEKQNISTWFTRNERLTAGTITVVATVARRWIFHAPATAVLRLASVATVQNATVISWPMLSHTPQREVDSRRAGRRVGVGRSVDFAGCFISHILFGFSLEYFPASKVVESSITPSQNPAFDDFPDTS